MFKLRLTEQVLKAVENSPNGIATLDVLDSLGVGNRQSLKITLSRLGKSGKIIRLKRGVYSSNPMKDMYACAQSLFNGYIGFASALYLHELISEMPFTVIVVTFGTSETKRIGNVEFRAVSLKDKAVGFERKGDYLVSTRAKTLFDCIYLPYYGIEEDKLVNAYEQVKLKQDEWNEFEKYCALFAKGKTALKMKEIEKKIRGD